LQQFTFQTGAEHLLQRQKVKRITTGVKAIDAILGGGIESNSLTEIYGEFRTGKSQWVHTMVVTAMVSPFQTSVPRSCCPLNLGLTAQLGRDEGGGQGKVCVIDTEGSFRSGRANISILCPFVCFTIFQVMSGVLSLKML
jgi:RecA/RadA recombinase